LTLTEKQKIALGFWPSTLAGWWFWLRYWSPLARAWRACRTWLDQMAEKIRTGEID
jgi:hypothetical protein